MNPDVHTTLLDMDNLKLMETILKMLGEQSLEDDQINTAGEIAGSIPETSLECEQVLGDVNYGYFAGDLVLIASPDWCKCSWHDQFAMLKNSQRRSMKQGWVRFRSTAEHEEIDGVHLEGIYDIVSMQHTDELHRRRS